MKKLLFLLFAVLLLCACAQTDTTDGNVPIYFLSTDRNGRQVLDFEMQSIEENTTQELLNGILTALKNPRTSGAEPLLRQGIKIESFVHRGSTLQINFNEMYSYLGAAEKIRAAVAVCNAIFSLGDIHYIRIYADGRPQAPLYDGYCFKGKFLLDDRIYTE